VRPKEHNQAQVQVQTHTDRKSETWEQWRRPAGKARLSNNKLRTTGNPEEGGTYPKQTWKILQQATLTRKFK
jgi:hypothetical protein